MDPLNSLAPPLLSDNGSASRDQQFPPAFIDPTPSALRSHDAMDVDVAPALSTAPSPASAPAAAQLPSTPPRATSLLPRTPDNAMGYHDNEHVDMAHDASGNLAVASQADGLLPADAPDFHAAYDVFTHAMDPPMNMINSAAMDADLMPVRQSQTRLPRAFARLTFDDGAYYMYTKQIIIGRNVALAHRDRVRQRRAELLLAQGDREGAEAVLAGRRRRRRHRPESVASHAGGIVSVPMSSLPHEYQQQRARDANSNSASSSSHRQEGQAEDPQVHQAPVDVLMQGLSELPDGIDEFVPENPNDCPLVPIHPQSLITKTGVGGAKAISRQHAKIFYNDEKRLFEIQVLSKQGLFHKGAFLPQDTVAELSHDDPIIIGRVHITFQLPEPSEDDEKRTNGGSSSRPMSFSFENGQGEEIGDEWGDENSDKEKDSVDPRHVFYAPPSESEVEDDDQDDADVSSSPEPKPAKQKLKLKFKNPPPKKEAKQSQKRKTAPEGSREDVITKKPKKNSKEVEAGPSKQNGKAPASAVAEPPATETSPAKPTSPKETAKEPTPTHVEKPAVAPKTPNLEAVALARLPNPEDVDASGRVEQGELITMDFIKQHNLPETLKGWMIPSRKGPGRPPKDGVMSKRQRAQLVKQGKEIERARAAGLDPADLPMPTVKPKAARPRKDSNANPGEGDEDDVRETTEKGDGTVMVGDKKQTKPTKPPRTPSPEMRREDYTEEQLQRPSANYVVLIHEAISSSKTGQMNLQQIYTFIERKYPYYKFKTTTSGWQSSVRHNLGQHDAFVKGDKEGKGFNWRINPEVSIEKERRKRQVSPQTNHAPRQGYYPPVNGYPPYGHPPPYYPTMSGHVPPNGAPPPPNVDLVQPRLPPSLARNAATATPSSQGPANPSPYASPWAGGNGAGQQQVRPFQQPNSHLPATSMGPAPSGQYGVLLPTTAAQPAYANYASSGPYAQPHNAGATPYSNAPRPYTPYAATGSQPNTSQPPPVSGHTAQPHLPTAPARPQGTSDIHPSGRYPADTNPNLVLQLEAFREVYLGKSPDKTKGERNVDNAIKAIVHPKLNIPLDDDEKLLVGYIRDIPTVKDLASGTPKAASVSTAAAIAASDAAVAATSVAKDPAPPSSSANVPPHQSSAPSAPTMPASSAAPPPQPAVSAPASSEPHKFAPAMTSTPPAPRHTPAPLHIANSRPSVEPLTPMVGSPVVKSPNAVSPKSVVPDKGLQEGSTQAGAEAPASGEGGNEVEK